MNKSSVKKSRASGKASRVTPKKAEKAKSARRSATAQAREVSKSKAASAARASQGKSTKTTVKSAPKSAPKPAAKAVAKPATGKTSQRSVQSIAEAMKTAKLALIAAANARPVRVPSPTVVPPAEPITHKFQVGQVVYYSAPTFGRAPAPGNFTVVKLLPSEGDEQQYRIKSNGEAFERVAKESQLDVV